MGPNNNMTPKRASKPTQRHSAQWFENLTYKDSIEVKDDILDPQQCKQETEDQKNLQGLSPESFRASSAGDV